MKCPKCGSEVEEGKRCHVCGHQNRSGGRKGFLNIKVYLVTLLVILLGVGAMRYMPELTLTGNQGNDDYVAVKIDDYEHIQEQLLSAYNVVASYDGENYYLMESDGLNRYDADLSNPVNLTDRVINYLIVSDDYIYFCDQYFDLYRVDKQFETVPEKLLNNIYYPLLVGERLYYQDDSDNESVHYLDLATNELVKLNDEKSYFLMVENEMVYYIDDQGQLKSVDQEGNVELLVAGEVNSFIVAGQDLYYSDEEGIFEIDLSDYSITSILLNESGEYLPYLMMNVYQGNLVFVTSQGIQMYEDGKLVTLVSGINYSKYLVLNDVVMTVDGDLEYTIYQDFSQTEQKIDGAMEV